MAIARLNTDSDATWCRAWVIDTTAEVTAFLATYNTPLGPKRGDMILNNEVGQLFIVTNGASAQQLSGIAVLPIDLLNDVANTLPLGNGGLGFNTAAQGDLIYGSAANVLSKLAKDTNSTRYLSNTGTSNNPAWAQVALATGVSDYAIGTWTITIGGSGGQSGQVYSGQNATYTKIGRFVILSFRVALSTLGTITGNVQIQGLPFTSINSTNYRAFNFLAFVNTTTNFVQVGMSIQANQAVATLSGLTAAGTSNAGGLVQADLSNTTILAGNFIYEVQ